jgi:hypothetical protein
VLEALPWVISTFAVLGVLVMTVIQGCVRRKAGERLVARRTRSDAAQTRRKVREATEANLERLRAMQEGDDPEGELADALNQTRDRR